MFRMKKTTYASEPEKCPSTFFSWFRETLTVCPCQPAVCLSYSVLHILNSSVGTRGTVWWAPEKQFDGHPRATKAPGPSRSSKDTRNQNCAHWRTVCRSNLFSLHLQWWRLSLLLRHILLRSITFIFIYYFYPIYNNIIVNTWRKWFSWQWTTRLASRENSFFLSSVTDLFCKVMFYNGKIKK